MNFLVTILLLAIAVESSVLSIDTTLELSNNKNNNITVRKRRIVGGTATTITEFPFMVAIESGRFLCGGSIITPRHIITAAHCVKGNPEIYKIRAGSSVKLDGGELYGVNKITKHPDYGVADSGYDLAVLTLNREIKFDDTKKSINMFKSNETIDSGASATATGWGTQHIFSIDSDHNQLQKIELKMNSKQRCRLIKSDLMNGEICANDIEKGQSACSGDSGGPLIVDGKLAGISIKGNFFCSSRVSPNVFTEISYFYDWIVATVN